MMIPRRLRRLAQDTALFDRFVQALPHGRAHALKAQAFCERLDIPYLSGTGNATKQNGGGRVLRDLALIAVARGVCVAADNAGYYIPSSRVELETTLRRQEGALLTKLDRIAALKQSADQLFGGVTT
jgi:hypothetical protein